jgi:hypothetical protein
VATLTVLGLVLLAWPLISAVLQGRRPKASSTTPA